MRKVRRRWAASASSRPPVARSPSPSLATRRIALPSTNCARPSGSTIAIGPSRPTSFCRPTSLRLDFDADGAELHFADVLDGVRAFELGVVMLDPLGVELDGAVAGVEAQ